MRYIEAPQRHEPATSDPVSVYLAGGISGCPDWQAEATDLLRDDRVVVLNPRRASFNDADPTAEADQVAWEQRHLHLPRVILLFWFPASTSVQPISLYELGAAAASLRRMVVGAHPEYSRRRNVVLQLAHAYPALAVHSTLADTIVAARSMWELSRLDTVHLL